MPNYCTVNVLWTDALGNPISGAQIGLTPLTWPLWVNGVAWSQVNNATMWVLTNSSGIASFQVPQPSICDPAGTQWQFLLPDGSTLQGTVPSSSGPFSHHDLKIANGTGVTGWSTTVETVTFISTPATNVFRGTVLVDNASGGNPIALTEANYGQPNGTPQLDSSGHTLRTALPTQILYSDAPGILQPASGVPLELNPASGYSHLYLVPTTNAGPPTTGTYVPGNVSLDRNMRYWQCISGSPNAKWKSLSNIPEYHVEGYGAVNDGTTDISNALQTLLNAHPNESFIVNFSNPATGTFPNTGSYVIKNQIAFPNACLPSNNPTSGLTGLSQTIILRGLGTGAYTQYSGRVVLDCQYDGTTGSVYPNEYAWVDGGEVIVADPGTNQHLNIPNQLVCINSQTPAWVTGNSNFPISIGITGATSAGGNTLAQITTNGNHCLQIGQQVTIVGVGSTGASFNGTFTVTAVPSNTTFQYALSNAGTYTSGGTAYIADGTYYLHIDPTDGVLITTAWQWWTHGTGWQSPSASINPTGIYIAKFQVAGGSIWMDGNRPRILQKRGRLGKLSFRGTGQLILENIMLTNSAATSKDNAPFVEVTNGSLYMNNVQIVGSRSLTANGYPLQDGVKLGGPGSPFSVGTDSPESITAYSCCQSNDRILITNNRFSRLRTPISINEDANTVVIHANDFASDCGNPKGGAINVNGALGVYAPNNMVQANGFAYPVNNVAGDKCVFDTSSNDRLDTTLLATLTAGSSTTVNFITSGWGVSNLNATNPMAYAGGYIGVTLAAFPNNDQWEMLYIQEPNAVGASGSAAPFLGTNVGNGTVTQTGTSGPLTLSGIGVASGSYLLGTNPATQEWVTISVSGAVATVSYAADVFGSILTNGSTNHNHTGDTLMAQDGTIGWTFPLMYKPLNTYPVNSYISPTAAFAFNGTWGQSSNAYRSKMVFDSGTGTIPVHSVTRDYGIMQTNANGYMDGTTWDNATSFRLTALGARLSGGFIADRSSTNSTFPTQFYPVAGFGGGPWGVTESTGPTTATITSLSWVNNVMTISTSSAHGAVPQQHVVVAGTSPVTYSGIWVVLTTPSTTTLTCYAAIPGTPGAYVSGGSTYVRYGFNDSSSGKTIIAINDPFTGGSGYYLRARSLSGTDSWNVTSGGIETIQGISCTGTITAASVQGTSATSTVALWAVSSGSGAAMVANASAGTGNALSAIGNSSATAVAVTVGAGTSGINVVNSSTGPSYFTAPSSSGPGVRVTTTGSGYGVQVDASGGTSNGIIVTGNTTVAALLVNQASSQAAISVPSAANSVASIQATNAGTGGALTAVSTGVGTAVTVTASGGTGNALGVTGNSSATAVLVTAGSGSNGINVINSAGGVSYLTNPSGNGAAFRSTPTGGGFGIQIDTSGGTAAAATFTGNTHAAAVLVTAATGQNAITATGQVSMTGPIYALSTKTGNYTMVAGDYCVIANASSLTITLPSASTAGAGRVYVVKNGGSGTSTTVNATSGNIDGSASDVSLASAYNSGRYISDGTNWFKV